MARYPFNDLVVICTAIWCSFLKIHLCIQRSLFLGIEIHTRGISFAEDFCESFLALMSNYNLCIFSPSTDKISVNSEKRKPNELPMGHINKESVRKECQKPLSSQLIPLFIFSELYRQTCPSLTYKVFNQNSVTSQ